MNNIGLSPKIRLALLTFAVTAFAGLTHWAMYAVAHSVTLPEPTTGCGKGSLTLGTVLDTCEKVNMSQFALVALTSLVAGLLGLVLVSYVRGVSFRSMIGQFNLADFNDSPQTLFFGMVIAGFLMTVTMGASTPQIMAVTALLRLSGFFLIGTPAAIVANWLFRGDVDSIQAWSERFEAKGTNGPAVSTLIGYLIFGLGFAMTLL